MKTLLNIIWVVFAGFELFLAYVLAGVIACIFIVTIPVGVASFRIAGYIIWPFGREVVKQPGAGVGSSLMNGLWFIIAGWWLALGHVVTGIGLAITIIGIPLAIANFQADPRDVFPVREDRGGPVSEQDLPELA